MKNFFEDFKYIIIILLFLSILFISYTNYLSTKEVIEDKYSSHQKIVEKSILQNINYINDAYKIAEKQLHQEMEEYSLVMREKYRQNPEVMEWDLEQMKEEFGDYDIYILNDELKIIKTTFEPDLGLDFSGFAGFSQVLRERLEGDDFVVDRFDLSTYGAEIKKYSYMPTQDNQYLLELSIEVQKKFPQLQSLDIFADATKLTKDYEIVEEISFFSVEPVNYGVAKLKSGKGLEPKVSELEEELARKAIISNVAENNITAGNDYFYNFLPVLISDEDDNGQWNSYVVGIKYDEQVITEEINKHRNLFFINGLIMKAVLILFIAIVIYLLRKFEYQANYDQLTGLANRKFFTEKINKLMKTTLKNGDKLAILFLDIDKFKQINDNFGHDTGDKVLQKIAEKLEDTFSRDDLICRLGGDEFVIALKGINSKKEIIDQVDSLREKFDQPLFFGENKIFISFSLGISIYPEDARELEELIKNSDHAMYVAKKNQEDYKLYNP